MSVLVIRAIFGLIFLPGISALSGWGIYKLIKTSEIATVEDSLSTEERSRLLNMNQIIGKPKDSPDYKDWRKIIKNPKLNEFIERGRKDNDKTAVNKLKVKCRDIFKVLSKDKNFEQALTNARNFCLRKN